MGSLKAVLPTLLSTDRLTLELFDYSNSHYDCMLAAINSPTALADMGDREIRTPAQLDALSSGIRLSRFVCQGRTPDTDVYYLMRLGHESGPLMGFVTLVQRAASTPPDLGWCILEQFMGQGYTAEAGKEVLRVAREKLGVDEIIAWPGIENSRSIRVAQKIGFVEGGTIIKTDGTGSTLVYILPGMKFDSSMRLSFRGEQKPQA